MTGAHTFAFPSTALASRVECGLSLAASGCMGLQSDPANRLRLFRSTGIDPASAVALTQIHSRIVRVAESAAAFADMPEGDGLITANDSLVPMVTVADCMPIWLLDPVNRWFGVLHSGWRGTGILRTALELAGDEWNAKPENLRVILGPHIRDCCYTVDSDRADYFRRGFGESSVKLDPEREAEGSRWPWRLSLAEANRNLASSLGILPEHIHDTGECTSCNPLYGSNRREGTRTFTRMLAWIRWR